MNNTALRAGAQSANNTHMVFANEEHERFYYEKLEQARYQDCYHKALIYILGISEDTRNHFSQIYDMKSGCVKTECLHQGWQTSGSVKVAQPDAYSDAWKKWSYESLPMIPEQWQTEVKNDTAAQYKVLKNLMHDDRVDTVVEATDVG